MCWIVTYSSQARRLKTQEPRPDEDILFSLDLNYHTIMCNCSCKRIHFGFYNVPFDSKFQRVHAVSLKVYFTTCANQVG